MNCTLCGHTMSEEELAAARVRYDLVDKKYKRTFDKAMKLQQERYELLRLIQDG